MAKEVAGLIKLQIKGGAANPSPPVGPALGSKGINIMEFCKQFNARTQDKAGKILPALSWVLALNCLQNSMILIPLEPKAGPTGGDGFAAPPLICNLISPATSLAIFLLIYI